MKDQTWDDIRRFPQYQKKKLVLRSILSFCILTFVAFYVSNNKSQDVIFAVPEEKPAILESNICSNVFYRDKNLFGGRLRSKYRPSCK